jgi:hypothetical protein
VSSNLATPTNNSIYLTRFAMTLVKGRSGFDPDYAAFEAGFGDSCPLRNRKAADWAGTRVNGQIEKSAQNGYQIEGMIAIAGGADV